MKVFPKSAADKAKLSTKMTLGYVFNFVPLALSNGKAIKTTLDTLQRLIETQKAINVEFIEEEEYDEIKTDIPDAPFLQIPEGTQYSLSEFLMDMTQKTGEDKEGSKLFFGISQGTDKNKVFFQFFKGQREEAFNVICGLPKIMEDEYDSSWGRVNNEE